LKNRVRILSTPMSIVKQSWAL